MFLPGTKQRFANQTYSLHPVLPRAKLVERCIIRSLESVLERVNTEEMIQRERVSPAISARILISLVFPTAAFKKKFKEITDLCRFFQFEPLNTASSDCRKTFYFQGIPSDLVVRIVRKFGGS